MTIAALVLAGSRGHADPVAMAEGTSHKALIPIAGEPMLSRVIGALRDAGITRIAVSASDPAVTEFARKLKAEIVSPLAGPSASVGAALAKLGTPLLVTTSDHALLSGYWVRDFLARAPSDADVAILLARREMVELALPGSRRTWLRFADGQWSGCNLFLLNTAAASAAIATWEAVEANRKRPWRIAMRLGLGTLITYAMGRLGLAEAIVRLGKRIGIEARLVVACDGLAAIDVDKPGDLAEVRRLLES